MLADLLEKSSCFFKKAFNYMRKYPLLNRKRLYFVMVILLVLQDFSIM